MGHITRETCLLLAVRGPCGGAPQPHCTSPRRTFQDLCSPRRARRTRRGNSVHSSSSHGWDRGRPPPHARRNPVRQLILSILSILRSSAAAKDELSRQVRSSWTSTSAKKKTSANMRPCRTRVALGIEYTRKARRHRGTESTEKDGARRRWQRHTKATSVAG
jgi:hypothetical protein